MSSEKPKIKSPLDLSLERLGNLINKKKEEEKAKELKYGVLDPKTGIKTKPATPEDLAKVVKIEAKNNDSSAQENPRPKSWMKDWEEQNDK